VILYADKVTNSMDKVIRETTRRRTLQREYNKKHNINPKTIYKTFEEIMSTTIVADSKAKVKPGKKHERKTSISILTGPVQSIMNQDERRDFINGLRKQMIEAAKDLEFERAAEIRDEIQRLEEN
jgi:excinuclease ABC subunit B